MRTLSRFVDEGLDSNELAEDQFIPIGDSGLTIRPVDGLDLVYRLAPGPHAKIVAVVQNGMLHESLTLLEPGLEDLLDLAGIPWETPIILDSVPEDLFEHPEWMPSEVAVWIKRMPGAFFSEAPLIMQPQRVYPNTLSSEDPGYLESLNHDQFTHILYAIERLVRREQEATYREPKWSLV